MRSLLFFICIILLCSCGSGADTSHQPVNAAAPDRTAPADAQRFERYLKSPYTIFSLSDTAEIYFKLFGTKRIERSMAVWEPRIEDMYSIAVSDDGLCRTKLDTVINVPDKIPACVLIFTTKGYDPEGKVFDCHSCAPVYSMATLKKEEKGWEITAFKKDVYSAGSWGSGADISLERFGKYLFAVRFSSGYMATGSVTEHEIYFETDSYRKIFSFYSLESNEGMYDTTAKEFQRTERELLRVPNRQSASSEDIKLTCKTTRYDPASGGMVTDVAEEYYLYDGYMGYDRTCNVPGEE
jgi:hypothetical protein